MTDDTLMTAGESVDVAALRRWLREHEDAARRHLAEIDALRKLLRRGIEWPSMSMDQSLWIREVKEWLEPGDE